MVERHPADLAQRPHGVDHRDAHPDRLADHLEHLGMVLPTATGPKVGLLRELGTVAEEMGEGTGNDQIQLRRHPIASADVRVGGH